MKHGLSALAIGCALCCTLSSFAQTTPQRECGYTGFSPWLTWYLDNKATLDAQRAFTDSTWLYVPVTFHLVGNNSGGGHYKVDQAIRALCEMNAYYDPYFIRFYLYEEEPFLSYNNSDWYQHEYDGGYDMIAQVYPGRESRFNIIIVDDPAGNCGYSTGEVIMMSKGCSGPGYSTMSHETGHHFSLPHTFYGWEWADDNFNFNDPAPEEWSGYPVEKTDGSNCYDSGDRFCDTPPDYLAYRWNCNDNGQSTEVQHDPDGIPFQSDGSFLMGYADQACRVRLSDEQAIAVRQNLYLEHSDYLQTSEAGPQIADELGVELNAPLDSQIVQYNDFTLNWNAVPNARYYHVQVGFNPTFSILLYNQTLTDVTSLTLTSGIPNNRTLYWRVRAYGDWDVCQPDNYSTGIFKTRNVTATNDLERQLVAQLSPNPVAGGMTARLDVEAAEGADVQLRLTDAAGRLCQNRPLRLAPGENQVAIPTEGLPAGIYLLTLQNEKGALTKRLAVGQ